MTTIEDVKDLAITSIEQQASTGNPIRITLEDGTEVQAIILSVMTLDDKQAAIDARIAAAQAELDALQGEQSSMSKAIADRASKTSSIISETGASNDKQPDGTATGSAQPTDAPADSPAPSP